MTTLQKRPTALFSPSLNLFGEDEEPRVRGGVFGGQVWVVPRADCQYRQQDFSQLAAGQRRAAARLAIPRLEPAPGARVHVAWQQATAHYWIWTPGDHEAGVREPRWIPETRLLPPPPDGQGGARLLALSRGVEGQVWRNGRLEISQWWPTPPDLRAWQLFLRAGGLELDAAAEVPEPVLLPWSDAPWGESGRTLSFDAAIGERIAWWGVAALLLCALGWQVTGLLRWQAAVEAGSARLDAVRTDAAPLLDARERAERAAAEIEALASLQRSGSDYQLMLDVFAMLPEGTRLESWSRDAGKLRVTVKSTEADPRRFIAPFADSLLFPEVVATPTGGGGMLLEFDLAPAGKGAME